MVAFSYRRESDYSVIETDGREGGLSRNEEVARFEIEAERVAR
jgi:hypothetical protein